MKLTKQDIKTLNKIKKLCDKAECEQCVFYRKDHFSTYCSLQQQPNWWNLDYISDCIIDWERKEVENGKNI